MTSAAPLEALLTAGSREGLVAASANPSLKLGLLAAMGQPGPSAAMTGDATERLSGAWGADGLSTAGTSGEVARSLWASVLASLSGSPASQRSASSADLPGFPGSPELHNVGGELDGLELRGGGAPESFLTAGAGKVREEVAAPEPSEAELGYAGRSTAGRSGAAIPGTAPGAGLAVSGLARTGLARPGLAQSAVAQPGLTQSGLTQPGLASTGPAGSVRLGKMNLPAAEAAPGDRLGRSADGASVRSAHAAGPGAKHGVGAVRAVSRDRKSSGSMEASVPASVPGMGLAGIEARLPQASQQGALSSGEIRGTGRDPGEVERPNATGPLAAGAVSREPRQASSLIAEGRPASWVMGSVEAGSPSGTAVAVAVLQDADGKTAPGTALAATAAGATSPAGGQSEAGGVRFPANPGRLAAAGIVDPAGLASTGPAGLDSGQLFPGGPGQLRGDRSGHSSSHSSSLLDGQGALRSGGAPGTPQEAEVSALTTGSATIASPGTALILPAAPLSDAPEMGVTLAPVAAGPNGMLSMLAGVAGPAGAHASVAAPVARPVTGDALRGSVTPISNSNASGIFGRGAKATSGSTGPAKTGVTRAGFAKGEGLAGVSTPFAGVVTGSLASSAGVAPGAGQMVPALTTGASSSSIANPSANPFEAMDAGPGFGHAFGAVSHPSLAVGYQDPALGYVELQARGGAGAVHVAMVADSPASGAVLAGHLGQLTEWMHERQTVVESMTVMAHGMGGGFPAGAGGGTAYSGGQRDGFPTGQNSVPGSDEGNRVGHAQGHSQVDTQVDGQVDGQLVGQLHGQGNPQSGDQVRNRPDAHGEASSLVDGVARFGQGTDWTTDRSGGEFAERPEHRISLMA